MSDLEFTAPIYNIEIGEYNINKLVSMDVISSRINPCSLVRIYIDCLNSDYQNFQKGDPVNISLGYKEYGLWNVFNGFVIDVSRQRVIEIFTKDSMYLLEKPITITFRNVTPQEIISYCLQQAGINQFILSSDTLPKKHCFICKNMLIIDIIKMINRSWNLTDWAFYFEPEGTFYWGPWQESARYQQGTITVFEYGKNIVKLIPSDQELGVLETLLVPFVRHSTIIEINDPKYWRRDVTARVDRIRHRIEQNKARTFIEWRIQQN